MRCRKIRILDIQKTCSGWEKEHFGRYLTGLRKRGYHDENFNEEEKSHVFFQKKAGK